MVRSLTSQSPLRCCRLLTVLILSASPLESIITIQTILMDFSHPDRKSDAEFQEILDTFVGDNETVLTGNLPDCKWHPKIVIIFSL